MVEMEIVEQRNNPLFKRVELEFVLHHEGTTTPKREEVRDMVAKKLKGKKENVVVDHLSSEYGKAATRGYAKLYQDTDSVKAIEPKHLLVRHGLVPKEDGA